MKHAPGWMKYMALEWFYRLLQEPNRLWRRYVKNNTLFILYTLRELLTGTLPGGRSA
ncbi:MAG TPA: WecB/TagA/CpsF family glycosyltransferase [bacterium]|nr:WecB/TagA/CpsF family glycosyltransferase [bacterium]